MKNLGNHSLNYSKIQFAEKRIKQFANFTLSKQKITAVRQLNSG